MPSGKTFISNMTTHSKLIMDLDLDLCSGHWCMLMQFLICIFKQNICNTKKFASMLLFIIS